MKNLFLSIVVVCAIVVAGVGGTLAGFSDTEQSLNNVFEVGNMDLKVSHNGIEYNDPFVPAIVQAYLAWPCTSQDFLFDLHNVSDNPQSGNAYICFKNFNCYEVQTAKHPTGRPEPEEVAENGGMLANVATPGMGPWGQDCTLLDFVEIYLEFDLDGDGVMDPVLGNPIWGGPGTVYVGDLWSGVTDECLWIPLGQIPGCETRYGKISLHISNWSEEEWNDRFGTSLDFFPNDIPFNDWLTNLFMNDGVDFTIDFGLTQDQILPPYIYQPPV
jgi:predicted ribosomally synthesized peptide with SipW-like signal peptide